MRDAELWQRLCEFRFDAEDGSEPFSVKLAASEDWTPDHTSQVIEEYRRFLYLTQVSNGEATPSVPVDRAWHMHLTFTRNYWDVLCGEVLGRPLHHDPCAGAEDMPRYAAQYRDTLALYAEEFGELPPPVVWPTEEHANLPGAQVGMSRPVMLVGAILAVLVAPLAALNGAGALVVLLLAGLGIVLCGMALWPVKRRKSNTQGSGGGGVWAGGCGTGADGGQGGGADGGGGGGGCGGGG